MVAAALASAAASAPPPRVLAYVEGAAPRETLLVEDRGRRHALITTFFNGIAWSDDGSRLALLRPVGNLAAVAQVGTRRGGPLRTLFRAHVRAGIYHSLAWSPDARSLAFLVQGPDPGSRLTILDVRTRKRRDLPARVGPVGRIDWSPDGKTIVAPGTAPRPFGPLVLVDTSSGRARPVLGPTGRSPAFSPDGRRLAYSARTGIVVLDLARGRLRLLTRGGHRDDEPSWSPDGRTLVYAHAFGACFSPRPGSPCNFDLFTVPAAGGRSTNLTRTPRRLERTPAWLS